MSRAIGKLSPFQIVVYTYGLDHAGALVTEPTTKREPALQRDLRILELHCDTFKRAFDYVGGKK